MDRGHLTVEDRLTRIRGLLKDIPGPPGSGLLAWVDTGDVGSMPQDVLGLIVGSAERLEEGWTPGGTRDDIPRDAADLMTKLTEVGEAKGIKTLVWLLSSTMAYGVSGRYTEDKARDVAETLARLLGYGARWWTNTALLDDYRSVWQFSPVTQHTFSAVVVIVGDGVIVTVLAVDED